MTTVSGIVGIPVRLELESVDGFDWNACPQSSESAVSRGAEISTTWSPMRGLRLQPDVTYTDAHLTQTVVVGSRLPNIPTGTSLPTASKWQFSEVVSYTFDQRYHPQIRRPNVGTATRWTGHKEIPPHRLPRHTLVVGVR